MDHKIELMDIKLTFIKLFNELNNVWTDINFYSMNFFDHIFQMNIENVQAALKMLSKNFNKSKRI